MLTATDCGSSTSCIWKRHNCSSYSVCQMAPCERPISYVTTQMWVDKFALTASNTSSYSAQCVHCRQYMLVASMHLVTLSCSVPLLTCVCWVASNLNINAALQLYMKCVLAYSAFVNCTILSCYYYYYFVIRSKMSHKWKQHELCFGTRVEAGSNTSTVNLRVVRGNEMGLKKAAP
jgi:hypothetical protein